MPNLVVRVVTPIRKMPLILLVVFLGGCVLGCPKLWSPGESLVCGNAKRCVSSLDKREEKRIEALRYDGKLSDARAQVLRLLENDPSARVVSVLNDYIHAVYRSDNMGFEDDAEFVFSKDEKRIDIRSSGRIGYYDFQANRHRIEKLRAQFNA